MTLTAISLLIAGPFAGSLAGVLINRLPDHRPVALDRSRCDTCGQPIAPYDLIPLASYTLLRGRCRACHAPIGRFHVHVELAALAIAASAVLCDPDPLRQIADCILGWTLLALAWIDIRHLILPDSLTLPLILAGLAEAALTTGGDPAAIPPRALGAALAWLTFALTAFLYRRIRKRDGLGAGDAKLFAAGGAWLGPDALAPCLLLAALIGLAMALSAMIRTRRFAATLRLPFGPPLALAIWTLRLLWPT
ncbi:prepilin peptidase [Tanticharoenia sakaeratensis]|uniref:Prepilin leader peptidase/N-methyltransferase n=1 Tax=Tanticharoenia sakaeratensis NBRC 103193 TaxID=1231623 RepID=A0A0D6MMK1_9PROT|nr:A24 family peptidase [Tanticharoenia sakaeratensis]GAN54676.1 A24 family peptidase [Tanticharoenia sakaeratensis NBRC 103193]GBQ16784.1 prepilin peptidase [Tanticharoenia sakaeratensis NBRC 103193]